MSVCESAVSVLGSGGLVVHWLGYGFSAVTHQMKATRLLFLIQILEVVSSPLHLC